jgi:hypothetical protein
MTLMNCRPLVESANADVTVNRANGEIQTYNITSHPTELEEAFADNFLPHNGTDLVRERGMAFYNVTVR